MKGTRVSTAAWPPGPTPLATATAHPTGERRLSTWRSTSIRGTGTMGHEMSTQDTSLPEMIDTDHPEIMDTDHLLGGGLPQ